MSFLLGLTGSIGMGKSTTAQMFRELGIPVWDADETVHRLYARGGAAVMPVSRLIPTSLKDEAIDRPSIKAALANDPDLLSRLERIVHPLVAADRKTFIEEHTIADLIVLDIPLLFETGGDKAVDATLVVTTDPEDQKARVLARPGMTEDLFEDILSRQMPDAEKRRRATHVIETRTLDQTRAAVAKLVNDLKETPHA